MRFLAVWSHVERDTPPTEAEQATMGKLIEEMMTEGTLVTTEGCLPTSLGARVRRSGDKITVSDGPFTESKEVIGGFAILEAKSKEHAIELTRRFVAVAGDGVSELRQIYQG